jgi:uncharacterized membrane protein YjgN (DUF898 family)
MDAVIRSGSAVPSIRAGERTELWFSGAPGEFFRLLLTGSLLLVPTFGFYRFWLVTDIRRHLWGHTRVAGEPLEYTGTAREVLIGFLIALAVLAPIYVAYFIAGLVAERLQAFASIPLLLVLYVFGQYARYRARRYRATRTVFRGLRFWMTGSGWAFALRAALWDLGTVLTLGLLYPWRTAALERYKMANTRFGDIRGDFVATGAALFRRGWALWVAALVLPGLLVPATILAIPGEQTVLLVLVAAANVLVLPLIYPVLQAIRLRWHVEGVRVGEVAFTTSLRTAAVLGCYAKWFFATLGFALAVGLVGAGLFAAVGNTIEELRAGLTGVSAGSLAAIGLTLLFYLVFLLGLGLLKRYFLDRGLWAAVVGSTAVLNLSSTDRAVAAGDAAGSLGEGLADALDVGGL